MSFLYSQLFITPAYPTHTFAGQTIIVTGSNVGLGKEAVRHLARLGASKIILAVRNTTAGSAAREDIIATTKCDPDVLEVWELDLSSYESVKAFAERAQRQLKRLDVLLENAGIATGDFNVSEGHERTITVNVISTFLLAFLLLPLLKNTAKQFNVQPRLTIVSSEVHAWTKFAEWENEGRIFATLSNKDTANMGERYQTSKLLEVLVVRHIAPHLVGSSVILNYLNPGLCNSELGRNVNTWRFWLMKLILARTSEVGSRTLIAAASAGEESHGKYMSDGNVKEEAVSPFAQSTDGALAGRRVWSELKDTLEKIQPGVTAGY